MCSLFSSGGPLCQLPFVHVLAKQVRRGVPAAMETRPSKRFSKEWISIRMTPSLSQMCFRTGGSNRWFVFSNQHRMKKIRKVGSDLFGQVSNIIECLDGQNHTVIIVVVV